MPEPDGPVTATSSPGLDGQRHALQRERLVVAGVEEAVQAVRLQHRAHRVNRSELVTFRHGSTLSDPLRRGQHERHLAPVVGEVVALEGEHAELAGDRVGRGVAEVGDPHRRARPVRVTALTDWSLKPLTVAASLGTSVCRAEATVTGPCAGAALMRTVLSLSVKDTTPPALSLRDQPSGVLTVSPRPGTA